MTNPLAATPRASSLKAVAAAFTLGEIAKVRALEERERQTLAQVGPEAVRTLLGTHQERAQGAGKPPTRGDRPSPGHHHQSQEHAGQPGQGPEDVGRNSPARPLPDYTPEAQS